MLSIALRSRRAIVLAAVSFNVAIALPAIALASGSANWCNGCYQGAGQTTYWNTYHSEVSATQAFDYYSDGAGNCTGVWQTSINGYASEICHAPASGPNTTTCSVVDTC